MTVSRAVATWGNRSNLSVGLAANRYSADGSLKVDGESIDSFELLDYSSRFFGGQIFLENKFMLTREVGLLTRLAYHYADDGKESNGSLNYSGAQFMLGLFFASQLAPL